jgi:hypothetical protein
MCTSGCLRGQEETERPQEKTQTEGKQKENSATQKKFDKYLQNLFVETMEDNSIDMHYTLKNPEKYGIKDQNSSLGDLKEGQQTEEEEYQKMLRKLREYSYEQLSDDNRSLMKYWRPIIRIRRHWRSIRILNRC